MKEVMEKDVIKLDGSAVVKTASDQVKSIADKNLKNSAYFNVLVTEGVWNYLNENDYVNSEPFNLRASSKFLSEYEVTDIQLPNLSIYVRAVYDEDLIFVPKKHFLNKITPDVYLFVKIDSELKEGTVLGYIRPDNVNKRNDNGTFYFINRSTLKPLSELLTLIKETNLKEQYLISDKAEETLEKFIMLYLDNDIDTVKFDKLTDYLKNSSIAREKLIEFENFERLSYMALQEFKDLDIENNDFSKYIKTIVPVDEFSNFEADDMKIEEDVAPAGGLFIDDDLVENSAVADIKEEVVSGETVEIKDEFDVFDNPIEESMVSEVEEINIAEDVLSETAVPEIASDAIETVDLVSDVVDAGTQTTEALPELNHGVEESVQLSGDVDLDFDAPLDNDITDDVTDVNTEIESEETVVDNLQEVIEDDTVENDTETLPIEDVVSDISDFTDESDVVAPDDLELNIEEETSNTDITDDIPTETNIEPEVRPEDLFGENVFEDEELSDLDFVTNDEIDKAIGDVNLDETLNIDSLPETENVIDETIDIVDMPEETSNVNDETLDIIDTPAETTSSADVPESVVDIVEDKIAEEVISNPVNVIDDSDIVDLNELFNSSDLSPISDDEDTIENTEDSTDTVAPAIVDEDDEISAPVDSEEETSAPVIFDDDADIVTGDDGVEQDGAEDLDEIYSEEDNALPGEVTDENFEGIPDADIQTEAGETSSETDFAFATYSDNSSSKKITSIIAASVLILCLAGTGAWYFLFHGKSANTPEIAIDNTDNAEVSDVALDDFNMGDDATLGGAENNLPDAAKNDDVVADVKIPAPANQTDSNNKNSELTIQKIKKDFTKPDTYLSVSKIVWDVPEYLTYNDDFNSYLQTVGSSLKVNISSDLLLINENPILNSVKIKVSIKDRGSNYSSDVVQGSGVSEIDNLVLQSVKKTMNILKPPVSSLDTADEDLYLTICL